MNSDLFFVEKRDVFDVGGERRILLQTHLSFILRCCLDETLELSEWNFAIMICIAILINKLVCSCKSQFWVVRSEIFGKRLKFSPVQLCEALGKKKRNQNQAYFSGIVFVIFLEKLNHFLFIVGISQHWWEGTHCARKKNTGVQKKKAKLINPTALLRWE